MFRALLFVRKYIGLVKLLLDFQEIKINKNPLLTTVDTQMKQNCILYKMSVRPAPRILLNNINRFLAAKDAIFYLVISEHSWHTKNLSRRLTVTTVN